MKYIVAFLLLAGVGSVVWLIAAKPSGKTPQAKQQAVVVSKHSDSFNQSVNGLLATYGMLTEDFVGWDSVATSAAAVVLQERLAKLALSELKKDSSGLYETAQAFTENIKGDAQTIAEEKNIKPQRMAFNSLTDNLYQFLNTVKYDTKPLYLQECPMAFDDTKPGQWLSDSAGIRNPYLGLHHPHYGKAMIECGETKTTINNTTSKQ